MIKDSSDTFHEDVKVEFIDCPVNSGGALSRLDNDSELLTKLRTELLQWYNDTIQDRRVQTADIFPQAIKIAADIGLSTFETQWDSSQFTNNFLRRNSIRLGLVKYSLFDVNTVWKYWIRFPRCSLRFWSLCRPKIRLQEQPHLLTDEQSRVK